MAIVNFKNKATRDIAEGINSKAAQRILPSSLHLSARMRLNMLNSADSLLGLSLPGFRLERLKGDRKGQYSIRVNSQYRICFLWDAQNASDVEIVDCH